MERFANGADVRLKSPFTAVIVGSTGSGKTGPILDLISSANEIANPPPHRIVYCYDVWQTAFEHLDADGVSMHKRMIAAEDVRGEGNSWHIIDNLMNEVAGKNGRGGSNSSDSDDLYAKQSHHYNISVLFVMQNAFLRSMRTILLNTHHFSLGKNPRDCTVATKLAVHAFPGKVSYVMEAFADATKEPYSFLLMDLRTDTPDEHQLLGNYGHQNGEPIVVYVPL